jgi:hypothetical protein
MKTLCICWSLAAATILLWPRSPTFQQRWPLMAQPLMSMEMFNAVQKTMGRPSFCVQPGKCRIG